MFGLFNKAEARKRSWTKGFKAGKSEQQKQTKSLRSDNLKLKEEIRKTENNARKDKDKLISDYEKKLKLQNSKSERTLKSVQKRLDYRIDKADKVIKDSERLLKQLKTFETWVVTQFKKSLQAQTSFINGLTHKIDEFIEEQDRIHKELTRIAGEKKMFEKNHRDKRVKIQKVK